MKNSFNRISLIYDRLSGLIFGTTWKTIQIDPASEVKEKGKVLIVGGGTGQILEGFDYPIDVYYLDLSSAMIKQAKRRATSANVHFINQNYLSWNPKVKFDIIIFPFFLDSFGQENLNQIVSKAYDELAEAGELRVTDFKKSHFIHNLFVWVMYRFFHLTTNLEGRRLLDFHRSIVNHRFQLVHHKTYFSGWVFYHKYTKCV